MARWLQTGQRLVVIFEGRDTAGKGGVINAITETLNPRQCRVVALAKPNEREQHAVVFPALRRAPAGGRRNRAVRPQLVQPRRRREGDGLLHRGRARLRSSSRRRCSRRCSSTTASCCSSTGSRSTRSSRKNASPSAAGSAQALEALADRPGGAREVRRVRQGARRDVRSHAHEKRAVDPGGLQRPEARPAEPDPPPARPPAGHAVRRPSRSNSRGWAASRCARSATRWSSRSNPPRSEKAAGRRTPVGSRRCLPYARRVGQLVRIDLPARAESAAPAARRRRRSPAPALPRSGRP